MNKTKDILKNILSENTDKSLLYKRNLLKEYLQVYVLDFIYSHPQYKDLIFYGGSCLAQCYSLPRLSEDLDFVDTKKNVDISQLADDIRDYFSKQTDLQPELKVQKFRIYLKFPILKELDLSREQETDRLFLKVEVFQKFDFCASYKTEIKPIFKLNKSLLVKTFDLPTLMSTKIRAVLNRKWEKTDRKGKTLLSVKGRDYFDLMWYLEKGVKPNLQCLDFETNIDLAKALEDNVRKLDSKSVRLDLENFIADYNFVSSLSQDLKEILLNGIKRFGV